MKNFLNYDVLTSPKNGFILANRADPDEKQHYVAEVPVRGFQPNFERSGFGNYEF